MIQDFPSSSNERIADWSETRSRMQRRILVVDDDAQIRVLNSLVLRQSQYHVDTADDGATAWDALVAENYDLLITDNAMPKVSGVELIQKVRGANLFLPIILASGTLPEDTDSLKLAAVLEKPFTPDELLKTVKEALQWQMPDNAPERIRRVASRLLAHESERAKSTTGETSPASRICEKLHGPLTQLMGGVAYRSLLLRALAVAAAEIPWLYAIQIQSDGSSLNLDQTEAPLSRAVVAAGELALVSQLLGLLAILIGAAMTLTLLRNIWPTLDDLNF
jgi:DNA-binding response OmpR family regulator